MTENRNLKLFCQYTLRLDTLRHKKGLGTLITLKDSILIGYYTT